MTQPSFPKTPILIKDGDQTPWSEERAFYVLTGDGLFVCRNHEFFESCAPARSWPSELERQEPFLRPRFPKLGRRAFERVVGFFAAVATAHVAEAAVLLAWDRRAQAVRVIVPEQEATVSVGSTGWRNPIGLRYFPPSDLGVDVVPFGDVHSHVYHSAYCSGTDLADEHFQTGVHLVVGRLHQEPPDLHAEAVVDGARFPLAVEDVVGGYRERRADPPAEWLGRVRVEELRSSSWTWARREPASGIDRASRGEEDGTWGGAR